MGASSSKEELTAGEQLVEELKAGFAQSRALSDMIKTPELRQLWNKPGFFYFALNIVVRRRLAEDMQLHFEEQSKLLDNVKDPVTKDMKNRQLQLSLIPTSDKELEVLHELKKKDNQLYEELVLHYVRHSSAQNIFNYYFNIPEKKPDQSESEYMEDSFVVRQTRRNMMLMGKSQKEIDEQITTIKNMWTKKDTEFVVKMVLAPCGRLTPTLKAGYTVARLLKLNSTAFGNNHAALQVGPYLIGWFDDSVVHIDVMSSSKAMLCLYPSDQTSRCFINRAAATENFGNSVFGKICSTIAQWNLRRSYNKLTANCQVFFAEIFPLTNIKPMWKNNRATALFVNGVLNQEVDVKNPFKLWVRDKGDNVGNYVRISFGSYEEFIHWCRDNMRGSYKHLAPEAREIYFVCLSIERCYLLRQASKGLNANVEPFFKPNGEVNHIGLTIFEKQML